MNDDKRAPVSVIVGMRNSASTIIPCLEGLASQEYPVAELIVIDNVSEDQSVALVESFAQRCAVPVRLIRQTVNFGLATSYNTGVGLASSSLVVLVHSDGSFPSKNELERLTAPLRNDPDCVAAFPKLLMPRDVWGRFPYWQKFLFARAVDREVPSMCGKFDCVRKDCYVKAGGYNTKRFTANCGYGGEVADAHHRISQLGRVIQSEARVIHLHDLSSRYDLPALFKTRKLLARTYAKILQFRGVDLTPGVMSFFVRPVLSLLPLMPGFFWEGVGIQCAFSLANSWKMYTSRQTLLNPRILLLPLVDIALIYYETIWFVEGLLTRPADACTSL
ncbi:MAG TPA: glycosyltransferase family 2 protein [Kiritimatiellia bacterium]|nr:glycosyltransferase family 2 protein [Kiritimatiellia bacterium]